jgi:hypothetical protein
MTAAVKRQVWVVVRAQIAYLCSNLTVSSAAAVEGIATSRAVLESSDRRGSSRMQAIEGLWVRAMTLHL